MTSFRKLYFVLLLFPILTGCLGATTGAVREIQPGERPDIASDEGGLWMAMDGVEHSLKTSGSLVTDAQLNSYVGDVVCKLAGPYCGDIRVYIVRAPHFNASMAPNGVLQVWTGLILRVQNESQLAYVLGHEIAHYLRRHSLSQWRDKHNKAEALVFLKIAANIAGHGYAGNIAQFIALASVFAYSRDHEREADELGFGLLLDAGYDPGQAANVWRNLIRERDASDEPEQLIFFSTHPATLERVETLEKLASKVVSSDTPLNVGAERFNGSVLRLRSQLLRDELRLRKFDQSQVVLQQLIESSVNLGELEFFQGELYRMRSEPNDEERAIEAYHKALAYEDVPLEVHRELGLLYMRSGKRDEARKALRNYITSNSDADDKAMIEFYLEQLE